MTLQKIANTAVRGQCQDDVVDQILGETPSLGNFFSAAPPSNPSPGDDALAIARADDWLYSEHSPEAVDDDCFPTAVAVATILREHGISAPMAKDRVESWNCFGCTPRLEQADIDLAVREAYSRPLPVSAVKPVQPGAQAAPTPLQPGAPTASAPPEPGASSVVETAEQARASEPDSAPPAQSAASGATRARPMSGAERMARRRAELRRLGLPGETKGRLKALKVTATAEIVTTTGAPTTPTAEIVTAGAEIVTPNATEAIDVR